MITKSRLAENNNPADVIDQNMLDCYYLIPKVSEITALYH